MVFQKVIQLVELKVTKKDSSRVHNLEYLMA